MKKSDKLKLLWISIIFYIINIANILLSVALFMNGEMTYFIVFWSLFGIDKLVTFFFGVIGKGIHGVLFWISDVLQLGFVFIIYSKRLPFTLEGALMTKLFARIFPLIISEIIIFFGCGFLLRSDVDLYVQILAYVNYVLFLVLAIIILTLISSQFQNKPQCLLQYMLTISSYYLTLASLLQFNDNFGQNLGYYYLSFFIINISIFWIATPAHELKGQFFENVFSQFLGNTLLNSYFNHTDITANRNTALVRCTTIVSYLNQLVRISLLLAFSSDFYIEALKNIAHQPGRNIICLINIALSATMSLLYLIYYFKKVIQQVFCVKILLIKNAKQLDLSIKYLKKDHKNLKTLYIQIYSSINTQNQSHKKQKLANIESFCSEECYYSYKLQKELGKQLQKKIDIYDEGTTKIFCKCFMMKLISEQQNIINSIQSEISYTIHNSTYIFSKIIYIRYISGYLQTQYTQRLQKQNIDLFNVSPIKYLRAEVHSINAFQKHISQFMIFSPKIILYDLYE